MIPMHIILSALLVVVSAAFYLCVRHMNKFMRKMVDALKESAKRQEKVTHIMQLQFSVVEKANQIIFDGSVTQEDFLQYKELLEKLGKAFDGYKLSKEQ